MYPWGTDFSYGKGSGSVYAVASFYDSGAVYPDAAVVRCALGQVESDAKLADFGAHGWTAKDARELRRIASGLRYWLARDYPA